jgi:hypothetical protein
VEGLGPIILAVIWLVVSLLGRAGEKAKRRDVPQLPRRDQPSARPGRPETFEDLLAEMRGELDRARRAEETGSTATLEGAPAEESWQEQVEEIETLEREAEVVSLEVEPVRPERSVFGSEQDAEELVQRRIAQAELRNREWRLEDHRRFDKAIRAPVPQAAPRQRVAPPGGSLRQAIIWREILGTPVSLRD